MTVSSSALADAQMRFGPSDAVLPRGKYLDLDNGQRTFLRTAGDSGDGSPTLLLHGLGATGALNWVSCFEPLARRGQVIAVDHRGHGRGARVSNSFSLEDCADDAAAVLRSLAARPAIVAGYSMGGPIAQLLAHRHPDLVGGLILSATARDFRGRPSERVRFAAAGALAAASAIPPVPSLPPVPLLPGRLRPVGWALSELQRHEPAALLGAAAALGRFTSRDWVHELDKPTTVNAIGLSRPTASTSWPPPCPTRRRSKSTSTTWASPGNPMSMFPRSFAPTPWSPRRRCSERHEADMSLDTQH
jgi:3-oxoadipate enol-lactonase